MATQTSTSTAIPDPSATTADIDDDDDDDDVHNDSQSEAMDMSDDTASSDSDLSPGDEDAQTEKKKRRISAVDDTAQLASSDGAAVGTKRARMSEVSDTGHARPTKDLSTVWPNGLWQRVFSQLPPAMLFRLMRVNKRFKYLLEHCKDSKLASRRGSHAVQQVDSESIWMQSRRSAYPQLPRPFRGRSEASMLRLVTAQRCEKCANRYPPAVGTTALNGGPGQHGVRPIWQFKRAVCGPCLKALTLTDVELFQMKEDLRATDLRKGLTFVFLTKDFHVVAEHVARQHPSQGIVKVYLRSDVDEILNDFKEAQAFGGGAQEEWVKGLDELGKAATADAMRWQRWEDQLPFGTHLPTHLRRLDTISFTSADSESVPTVNVVMPRPPIGVNAKQHSYPINTMHPLPKPVHSVTFDHAPNNHVPAAVVPENHNSRSLSNMPPSHANSHNRTHSNKTSRPASEAQQALRTRRAEIERRAMQLIPCIEPDVLMLMDSFKAAIQIAVPLTDPDWQRLKPRLEAEREAAEQAHYHQVQTLAALNAANPINWQYPEGVLPQSKEDDREWEASQVPLRELLSFYADEAINGTWRGQVLTQDMVPFFAADVLTRVHDQFHRDRAAKGDQIDPHNPATFLSLDAMKWLFENKIRPLTEHHLRDMFMCAGCVEEGLTRWFAFEGLIQHYGAKHTTDFSKGNITVHWQTAEWTDDPPFITDAARLLPKHRKHQGAHARAHHRQDRNRPTAAMLLSANPLFAGNQETAVSATPPFDEDTALQQLSYLARETWTAFENVRAMNATVRILTILSRLCQDFEDQHRRPLPLELFMKAVTINDKNSFTELKEPNTLTCGFCEPTAQQFRDSGEWLRAKASKKHYKLVNLLNHFQLAHVPHGTAVSEWLNAIELPDTGAVTDLMTTPGMNDDKLGMVDRACPSILPYPLREIGEVQEPPPDSGLARRLVLKQFGQTPAKGKKKKANAGREYNPNDAMMPPKPVSGPIDMSKFDTDPVPSSSAPGPPNNGADVSLEQLSLNPNTLAALQSFYSARSSQDTVHQTQLQLAASTTAPSASISLQPAIQSYAMPDPPRQHDPVAAAAESDPNIAAIIDSIRRSSARQTGQHQQAGEQIQSQHQLYQPQPSPYPTQSPGPLMSSTPHAGYGMPPPQPPQEVQQPYHPYGLPQHQQYSVPQMPLQQAWPAAPYQQYPAGPQHLQPVPLPGQPNQRLFYDPRTGQVLELVPDDS